MQNKLAGQPAASFAPFIIAFISGLIISAVDNFAAHGEVSPIAVVPMLLIVAAILAALWGTRAFVAIVPLWLPLPGAHLVKHLLGLPDTIHPNTYASIGMLAVFSLIVCAVGFGVGASSLHNPLNRIATTVLGFVATK